ncbi:hypothetical protein JZ751_023202 [Albula glossodonta]|uniref:Phosphotransferase n=1 Tax=Albula glossodonta TaxID=121402 RepID=A0A8T2PL09_9TELE|nr:hypothetical protein JZ751_023202 [Albula glossodonta]
MSNTETNDVNGSPCAKRIKLSPDAQDTLRKVDEWLQPFRLSREKLREVSSRLRKDLIRGLGKHTHRRAPVKMLPTFVRATPDGTGDIRQCELWRTWPVLVYESACGVISGGPLSSSCFSGSSPRGASVSLHALLSHSVASEKGDFLALDLGGTNFRVLHVRVVEEQQKVLKMDSKICAIPQEIMLGPGEQLFDHIATCLSEFLESLGLKDLTLPLGFTFSFPCEQKDIDKSILIRWTKGFNCSGVEGEDVVRLLREAIHRRGDYDISSVAMVNDTVGTMMSCGYRDQSCEIGMIIGTGTNACYMEEMKNVKRVEGEAGRMCINTEWGGFGDNGSLKDIQTEFDVEVDRNSLNPGVHTFEKMISGMYLGEVVRLVLIKLAQQNMLFGGKVSEALEKPDAFETRYISEIEEFSKKLQDTVKILAPKCDISFLVSEDGSGKGAAMVTAVAQRLAMQSRLLEDSEGEDEDEEEEEEEEEEEDN